MEDLISCPLCEKAPNLLTLHDKEDIITYACCGHTAVGLRRWNQYAAAMELAQDLVACDERRGLTPKIIERVRKAFQ